jgi:hypothetical protein
MKKSYVLLLFLLAILVFSSVPLISAEEDNIFEIWYNPTTGLSVLVNPYNHDNSVFKGPDYQAKIIELLAEGYVYKSLVISTSTGGGGPQFGSYDENYVLTSIQAIGTDFNDSASYYFNRFMWGLSQQGTTPDGFYVNDEWVPIDETWLEENVDLDDIEVDGHFTGRWVHSEGRFIISYNWTTNLPDTTREEGTIFVIRDDIDPTHTIWYIGDDIEGILMLPTVPPDWDDLVIEGIEEDKVRTIIFEIPQAPAGTPQLLPKYYGVLVLGTKYGPKSIEEIPAGLLIYTKEINGQIYTYSGSPLDEWIYENIYKPNHDKSFIE